MNYRILLTLLLTVSFAVQVFAQPPQAEMFRSKIWQDGMRRTGKTIMKSVWSGSGSNLFAIQLLNDKEVREAWGMSDDEYKNIQGIMTKQMMSSENAAVMKEVMELHKDKNLFSETGDKEKQNRYFELQAKTVSAMFDKVAKEIEKNLSPEQIKKMQEFQLASMGDFPIVSTQMFQALDLSEEQTKKMDAVKKELEPRFEALTDNLIDTQLKLNDKIWAIIEKEKIDLSKNTKIIEELTQRIAKEDAEFQKLSQELQTQNQLFATQMKFKMFDILTDEQLAKLENIIKNQPDYVKNWVQKMKKMMGQADSSSGVSNAFLNSWKPGEPIPAEYKQNREKKKFPPKE